MQALQEGGATMTRDDIIRMAREAGAGNLHGGEWALFGDASLERFAALVEAPLEKRIQDLYSQIEVLEKQLDDQYKMGMEAEREACAKVCEAIATETYGMTKLREYGECAAAIRARGEK
jgi:hypothetical protein